MIYVFGASLLGLVAVAGTGLDVVTVAGADAGICAEGPHGIEGIMRRQVCGYESSQLLAIAR